MRRLFPWGQAPRVQESVLGGYAEKVHGACLHFGRLGGRFEIAFGASWDAEMDRGPSRFA